MVDFEQLLKGWAIESHVLCIVRAPTKTLMNRVLLLYRFVSDVNYADKVVLFNFVFLFPNYLYVLIHVLFVYAHA